ncbi:hypothetical protein BDV98DRAFT_601408 [Pterulicium gracile]|uniref:Uncharacterized protein n=1 Tax=Pterulicium gracile TaxID=1884261 RepID=A0A5C3QVY8_9AGAR|nr:hypothetical protein BDV98DRAFT_601408 [Pterula gracilis]
MTTDTAQHSSENTLVSILCKEPWSGDSINDMSNYTINEALLTDDAFLPKSYIVSLEKGRFITAFDQLGEPRRLEYTPEYALRLTFDRSPYPPREEWRRPEGAPDAMKFWEWREFCGGKL